jgi:hypothetical protein
MNVTQRDQTFQDGIGRGYVLQAIHGNPESKNMKSVFRTLQPAPLIFIDIVCFAESGLVRFIGMRKLGVKKCLSKITGGLEAQVQAVEDHQDLKFIRESGRAAHTYVRSKI